MISSVTFYFQNLLQVCHSRTLYPLNLWYNLVWRLGCTWMSSCLWTSGIEGKIHVVASCLASFISLLSSLWKNSDTLIGYSLIIIVFLASRHSFMTLMETNCASYISSKRLSLSSSTVSNGATMIYSLASPWTNRNTSKVCLNNIILDFYKRCLQQ